MSLVFHDGFETGGADAWGGSTGTVSVQDIIKKTGNYALRSHPTSSNGYVFNTGQFHKRISVFLYIADAPDQRVIILGQNTVDKVNVRLGTDRRLGLYELDVLRSAGTTVLDTGKWYRISVSCDGADNVKVYIDGVEELSSLTSGLEILRLVGILTAGTTADLYFDNYAADDTASTDDIGDIRTLAARPIGQGVDNDAGSDEDDWRDPANNAATYVHLDSDPPNITDYLTADGDAAIYRYSVTMDECGSGNLSGIGGSDTIEAVNFMFYYETEGGGADDYGSKLIVSDGTLTNDNIDDPKDPTWLNLYHADTPQGANPWTQAYVNSIEMGMASVSSGGKDQWW